MKKSVIPVGVILLAAASARILCAEPAVVVLRPTPDTWAVQRAEKVLINGKNKIRIGDAGQVAVTNEESKRATESLIGSMLLRRHRAGYLVARSGSGWATAIPEGVNLKVTASAASLWSDARVQIQTPELKGPETAASSLFAILPGENPGDVIAAFLQDETNFIGIGEKDTESAFKERMSLLVSVAKSPWGTSPQLKTMLLSAMNAGLQKSKDGATKYADIERGLKFAVVSEDAFPSDPRQKQVRDQLRDRKAWIDRRVAILRALDAGGQYDALIDKYSDFEYYDNSFPDLKAIRLEALKKSADLHVIEADRLEREHQLLPALHELKLALLRKPGDLAIEEKLESTRLAEAKSNATTKKRVIKDPTSTEQIQLVRHLTFADSYIKDEKWDEAKDELKRAELVDQDSPLILLARARLFVAQDNFAQALEMLDSYDRVVTEAGEIKDGNSLRYTIQYESKKTKTKLREEIKKAESNGDFMLANTTAMHAVKVDPQDPDFLYGAGVISAITHREHEASEYLNDYLKASTSVVAESARRAEANSLLSLMPSGRATTGQGAANWFSGYAVPPGLLYCPISLMPALHPLEVHGSHKLSAIFDWQSDQLVSVKTVTMEPGETQTQIYFDYFGRGKGVRRVSIAPLVPEKTPAPTRFTSEGTVGAGDGVYTGLLNHPDVNPYMVEKALKTRVATLVSGNSFFHPFVWDGVHTFLAEYDSDGRVKSAQEIRTKEKSRTLDFQWDGNKLLSISERGAPEGYKREIQYVGNRITGEAIRFGGRNARIEYKYKGDQLMEAVCDPDPSLDNRSRHVMFRN